jgi:squalene cyclase
MRTKSGLLIAITLVSSLALSGCAPKETVEPATANFLAGKFVTTAEGTYLEGFTPGKADTGFTLEAIAQLSQAPSIDLEKAKKWVLENTDKIVDDKGAISSGLAGKWVYVSHLVDYDNKDARAKVTKQLADYWKPGYDPNVVFNTFDTAWTVLALKAEGYEAEAKFAGGSLSFSRRADNGWGTDFTEATTASSTDATAIALMAFIATDDQKSADVAKAWLHANMVTDHFEAWGDVDVNGTAYATMALHAAGEDVSKLKAWLKKQVVKDGGLKTPWSAGKGDTFATAQAYLPLIGLDYVGLIK